MKQNIHILISDRLKTVCVILVMHAHMYVKTCCIQCMGLQHSSFFLDLQYKESNGILKHAKAQEMSLLFMWQFACTSAPHLPPLRWLAGQVANQPDRQPASQSANQPTSQPARHLMSHTHHAPRVSRRASRTTQRGSCCGLIHVAAVLGHATQMRITYRLVAIIAFANCILAAAKISKE